MTAKNRELTFPAVFNETVSRVGTHNAYSFVGEQPITFNQANIEIRALMAFLEKNGINSGDKVAILSPSMPNWGLTFFSITFMGAVAIPILPDFSATETQNVLEHSEAKAVFVAAPLMSKIEGYQNDTLKTIIQIEDFNIVSSVNGSYAFNRADEPQNEYKVEESNLASIIYTSGTTGRSKGVMLTHKNVVLNAIQGGNLQYVDENDKFLSVLPMSHSYENTLGLILPLLGGSCVYYLRKPATPAVLLPALAEVKPTVMLTVPLIMEKIYFNKILPTFRENAILNFFYKISVFRKMLHKAAGKKLLKTFGGKLKFFGVGGAKLNKSVERFMREAKFPYAVGYGLTEAAPLIAGANAKYQVFESTGPAVDGLELKLNNPDAKTGEGEVWARGANVMQGYYKEPKMTEEILTPDGWLKTGDLGKLDKKNNLYIKGRLKTMILSASGENIYPEEIESVINNFRYVIESLVIEKKGKLVAMVHLNMEEFEKKYQYLKDEMSEMFEEKKQELIAELQEYVNSQVSKFCQINMVVLQPVPFQKTATAKIKRFLYT
jgi:long-chain acyl-CoA synthetase